MRRGITSVPSSKRGELPRQPLVAHGLPVIGGTTVPNRPPAATNPRWMFLPGPDSPNQRPPAELIWHHRPRKTARQDHTAARVPNPPSRLDPFGGPTIFDAAMRDPCRAFHPRAAASFYNLILSNVPGPRGNQFFFFVFSGSKSTYVSARPDHRRRGTQHQPVSIRPLNGELVSASSALFPPLCPFPDVCTMPDAVFSER